MERLERFWAEISKAKAVVIGGILCAFVFERYVEPSQESIDRRR